MKKLLATVGFLLLLSDIILIAATVTAFGVSGIPMPLLCGPIPFLALLGLLLLGLGLASGEKPPPGIARL